MDLLLSRHASPPEIFPDRGRCAEDSESDLAECFAGAGGEVATRLGNVLDAGEAQDTHGQYAQGRHHMGSVLGTDLRVVFVESGVANMTVTVFDLPMASGDTQQLFRRRAILG